MPNFFVVAFNTGWSKNAKKIKNIGMVSEMYHPTCTATLHGQRVTRNQRYLLCPQNRRSVFFGDILRKRACCLGKQVLPHEGEVYCHESHNHVCGRSGMQGAQRPVDWALNENRVVETVGFHRRGPRCTGLCSLQRGFHVVLHEVCLFVQVCLFLFVWGFVCRGIRD